MECRFVNQSAFMHFSFCICAHDLRQPLTSGRTALVAVPIVLHLIMRPQADAAGVSRAAVRPEAARREPAAAAAAAPAAAAAAGGGDRAAGLRPGPAEREVGRRAGQPGGPGGGGPGVRHRAAHGLSPREPDPAGGGPGARPLAAGPTARAERDRRARHAARLGGGVSGRPRRGQGSDRAAGDGGQLAAAAGGARRGRASCCGRATWTAKEIYVFTDLSRGGWPAEQAAAAAAATRPSWATWAST